jgi:putative transposase
LSRRHGVTEQTLYRWKKKYGGLEGAEAKRLRALEEEIQCSSGSSPIKH